MGGDHETNPRLGRIGIFAVLVHRLGGPVVTVPSTRGLPGTAEYYQRALILSLWLYVYDWGHRNGVAPTDLGFPTDFPGPQEVRDQIIEIHRATCNDSFFDDCGFIGVEPVSWGSIKARYRD